MNYFRHEFGTLVILQKPVIGVKREFAGGGVGGRLPTVVRKIVI